MIFPPDTPRRPFTCGRCGTGFVLNHDEMIVCPLCTGLPRGTGSPYRTEEEIEHERLLDEQMQREAQLFAEGSRRVRAARKPWTLIALSPLFSVTQMDAAEVAEVGETRFAVRAGEDHSFPVARVSPQGAVFLMWPIGAPGYSIWQGWGRGPGINPDSYPGPGWKDKADGTDRTDGGGLSA